MVGHYFPAAGGQESAFLWEGGRMYDLTDLLPLNSGWVLSTAVGVNATQSQAPPYNGQWHAYQITDPDGVFGNGVDTITDLGLAGRVDAMSDDGTKVVGTYNNQATLWQDGRAVDLGTLGRDPRSYASGVNDAGQVVGGSGDNLIFDAPPSCGRTVK